MPPSDTSPPFESRYPELHLPEGGFQSTIPAHLLENSDPQMMWLLQEVSKNTQATEFACRGVVDMSQHLRTLNGQTNKNKMAISAAQEDVDSLKGQAKVVTPFLKPISMFAALWEYMAFKVFFVGGAAFFLLILYPWLLKIGLLDLLDSYIRGH